MRLVVLGLIGIGVACGPSTPKLPHDRATAYVMCQDWVKEKLRAPASADFPFGAVTEMKDLGNGRYRIASYVDSQNGFGAQLRTDYVCETQWVTGTQWRLEDLSLQPR